MNRAGDRYHYLAICYQTISFSLTRNQSRISQSLLNVAIFVQRKNIFASANYRNNDRSLECRFANGLHQHSIARLVQSSKIVCNLTPVSYSTFITRSKAEFHRWRRNDGRSESTSFLLRARVGSPSQ